MNYQLHYDLLIEKTKFQNRKRFKRSHPEYIYYENHHITPRCLGGTDLLENLILLTPEEHFLAHLLLSKIYPDKIGLICATIRMAGKGNGYRNHHNKTYGWLRRQHAENMHNFHKDVPKTPEHIKKVADALRGRKANAGASAKKVSTRMKNGSYATSDSTKELMRQNRAKQADIHNVRICVFGVNYDSIKRAREVLNVGRTYLINRLKSEKFPDCYYSQ